MDEPYYVFVVFCKQIQNEKGTNILKTRIVHVGYETPNKRGGVNYVGMKIHFQVKIFHKN